MDRSWLSEYPSLAPGNTGPGSYFGWRLIAGCRAAGMTLVSVAKLLPRTLHSNGAAFGRSSRKSCVHVIQMAVGCLNNSYNGEV